MMNVCVMVGLGVAVAVGALAQQSDGVPALTPDDIGTSARVPSVGRAVTYTGRLRAPADQAIAGDFRVSLDVW